MHHFSILQDRGHGNDLKNEYDPYQRRVFGGRRLRPAHQLVWQKWTGHSSDERPHPGRGMSLLSELPAEGYGEITHMILLEGHPLAPLCAS